ncbi:unnamed protein product [Oreochromis niloticus]|nr:unnamed protein product [Mustela putorius furo]
MGLKWDKLCADTTDGAPAMAGAHKGMASMMCAELNSNICQLCIQPEALACCAQALGRDFRPLLTTWLYPVLEKAGEETLLVSQAALSSIWNINKVCGYASLKELINENSDYLLNDISLNLQRLSLHLQAPPVLTVLLTHSDCSLLVGDMVQDLDLSYERTAALFCSALHALMKALARWFPSTCSRTSTSASSRQSSSDQEDLSIRQFLLNYRKQKELAESIGIEDDDTEDRAVSLYHFDAVLIRSNALSFSLSQFPPSSLPTPSKYWKELRQTSSCNRAKCPNSPGCFITERVRSLISKTGCLKHMDSSAELHNVKKPQPSDVTDRPMGMIWLDVASLRPFDLVIPFTIQKGEVTGEVRMASGKVAKLDITDNNDGTVADKYAPTEAGLHEMDIKYNGTHIPGSPLQFYMDCMNGAYGPGLIHDPSGDVPRLHAWKHSARNPLLHPSPAAEPQTC